MYNFRPTGSGDFPCEDCKQLIRVIYGYEGAANRVLNVGKGRGGEPGQEHVCPVRYQDGSHQDKSLIRKKLLCHRCTLVFTGEFYDCPACFRLQCQNCGHLRPWRRQIPPNANEPEQYNNCGKCGSLYNDLVTITRINPDNPKPIKRKIFYDIAEAQSLRPLNYYVELDVYDMVPCPPFDSVEEHQILFNFRRQKDKL